MRHVCFFVRTVTVVLSVPLAGAAADHVGRKTVAIVALTGLLLSSLVSTIALEFHTYVMAQIVVVGTSRSFFVVFSILYEVTTAPRRLLYGVLAPAISTVLGQVLEFCIDTYKIGWFTSHLVIASLGLLLLATFYVLEESPAWLLATGNATGAERSALRAARRNGVTPSSCSEFFSRDLRGCHRSTLERSSPSVLVEPLRTRTILCGFFWLVLSWSHTHYSSSRGIVVDRYAKIGTIACLVPLFFVVWMLVKRGSRVKEAVATSLLMFSALSALLFSSFNVEAPILRTVLLVAMRVSINLPLAFLFYLTASLSPILARRTTIAICYVIGTLGEHVGHAVFSLVIPRREDIALGVTAVLTALAAVAVSCLTSTPDHGRTSAVRPPLAAAPVLEPPTRHPQEPQHVVVHSPRRAPTGKRRGGQ